MDKYLQATRLVDLDTGTVRKTAARLVQGTAAPRGKHTGPLLSGAGRQSRAVGRDAPTGLPLHTRGSYALLG